MFNIQKLSRDILKLKSQNDFELYLESNFIEIENYLLDISNNEIDKIKFHIEDMLYDMIDYKLMENNSKIINAFLILLSEKFLQASLIGSITIINNYIHTGSIKLRLEAAKLYLKINDITKDFKKKSSMILELLDSSAIMDEYNTKAIESFLLFIQIALQQFHRIKDESLAKDFLDTLSQQQQNYSFLKNRELEDFFQKLLESNMTEILQLINIQLNISTISKKICVIEDQKIEKESGFYAQTLEQLTNPTFESIRKVSYQYIQKLGNPTELYYRLQRGEMIIDDKKLLYKYLLSFGIKHKVKLESAFDMIILKIKNQKFDIIDWGCGQGIATMVLLNYARNKNITFDIQNITFIEPSKLALSRALLHIDILKQKKYNINIINSDLDSLDENEIIKSGNKILHLFSNILDIETFSLNNNFFKKVSNHHKNDAIFTCVSPNRNDKLNNRLNLFYKYFDENFDTELISSRDTEIGGSTRYEKIFEVKYIKEKEIEEKRHQIEIIQVNSDFNSISALKSYSNYLVPILDMKMLEESINIDPEYAIFKIRKVAEVITTKIYSKYETNIRTISFNDKIRYLTYEKKVFNKILTNYVQTLRTIGNSGVHEHERNLSKLKLDAHLMVIALINFIQELKDDNLI